MISVPDHMIDCSDQPDIEALKRLSSGEYNHVETDEGIDEPTSAASTLAVIVDDFEIYTVDLDPSENTGDICSTSGKSCLSPEIGGLVVIQSSAVSPKIVEVELPD